MVQGIVIEVTRMNSDLGLLNAGGNKAEQKSGNGISYAWLVIAAEPVRKGNRHKQYGGRIKRNGRYKGYIAAVCNADRHHDVRRL